MLIAKVQNDQVVDIADYQSMFPQTSFPTSGPDAEFLAANSCMTVTVFKPYDNTTEKLVAVNAYIEGDTVYTVTVEPLTEEEIAARDESAKAKVKAQAENLLQVSDWSQYADVTNPLNTPHLVNSEEWTVYRSALRALAINPPVTVETWPTKPEEQWSV